MFLLRPHRGDRTLTQGLAWAGPTALLASVPFHQAGIPPGFPFLSLAHRTTIPEGLVLERWAREMAEQAQKHRALAHGPLRDPSPASPGLERVWAPEAPKYTAASRCRTHLDGGDKYGS